MHEINVVPYIDVMLVLLIIFMITAPLLTQGVKVDLPKAAAEPLPAQDVNPLILSVDPQGRLFLNRGAKPNEALSADEIEARAQAELARHPEVAVLVRAAETVPYGMGVKAMVRLQRAGAHKVGLVTEPEPAPPRRG